MANREQVIGRLPEKRVLDIVLASKDPELVAVYGRRRVGKTFLIREHCKPHLVLEMVGMHDQSTAAQLANFHVSLRQAFPTVPLVQPNTWLEAFDLLRHCLQQPSTTKGKRVVFVDEFPWLATRKSGFVAAFENFWNTYASRKRDLAVIVCGSAAAWMIRNVINARGGLHNRLTRRIKLDPFLLNDVQQYLLHRKIRWDQRQIATAYMAFGGIPHYLNLIQPGQSAVQCIENECFRPEGMLTNEYHNLYAALFESHATHEAIVKVLATSWTGLTREQLLAKAKLTSGGGVTKAIEELRLSGFVSESHPLDKKAKGSLLRLTDEFSVFYWHWMHSTAAMNSWMRQSTSRRYEAWCGYAFESICFKHLEAIRREIGIADVQTQAASWRHTPQSGSDDEGAQIDLLLDRADHCINICEIKFADQPFVISKSYARLLERKLRVFRKYSGRHETLFLTMITPYGIAPNRYSEDLVTNQVVLNDLFV
ncbi:MAG: ATP-binding protein [Pirellulaceae bacterium]|nr:ATP-binding protein [Pirellulaceae bacterium]